jgi:hypothetical protein
VQSALVHIFYETGALIKTAFRISYTNCFVAYRQAGDNLISMKYNCLGPEIIGG